MSVRNAIVNQVLDDVKTAGSARTLTIAPALLERLNEMRNRAEFSKPEDFVFASPFQIGRLPWSYTAVARAFSEAAKTAGVGKVGTHTFRHTYRSWLDAVGTSVAVQQKLMRHSDIRTTMNVYGDVVTNEMQDAGIRVAELAFRANGAQDRAHVSLSN